VTFNNSKAVGVNFSSCNGLSSLIFKACLLDYSIFQGVEIPSLKMENSSLKDTDLSESKLVNACFSGCNLQNAIFNSSDLSKADFRNAKNYYLDPQYTKIRNAKFSMPEAMSLLSALEIIVE